MKKKSIFSTVFLIGVLFFCLSNCKNGSNEPAEKEPEYVKNDSINQNVFIINSNEAILNKDSMLLSQGIYELQFKNTPLKFNTDDIIVSQDNQGYLRKVSSSAINGNNVILHTEQGTLEDLYKRANISFQLNLSSKKNAKKENAILRETKINFIEKGINVNSNGMSYDFSNTILFQNGPLTYTITNGNLTFEPNFNFDINIESSNVNKIVFYADNADLNLNCDININTSQKIQFANYSKELANIDVIYTAGLLIVVVNTKLVAKLTADVKAELNLNTGFINKYKMSLGTIYENSIWTGKYDLTPTFTTKPVDLSGSVQISQQLTITPEVSVRLYGVVGPYCTPEMYENFEANVASPSLDWDALLKVGVNTTVGANTTIFGKALPGFSKSYNIENELWKAPYLLTKISGDNQHGSKNQTLSQALKIRVTDNLNNALKNVVVYFNVSKGGGSVSNTSVQSDSNGYAETIWTLGDSIDNEVTVKVTKSNGTEISGSSLTFTSLYLIPVLSTNVITDIMQTSAISGGTIINDGGSTITARGVCWSTHVNPTISDNKTSDGSGAGSFPSSITGLTPEETYFVRAYATNISGTAYGEEVSFTTAANQITHLQGYYHYVQYIQSFSLIFDLNLQNGTGTITIPEGQYPATSSIIGTILTCTSIFDYTYQLSGVPYTDHRTYIFSGQLNGNVYSGDVNLTVVSPGGTETQNLQGTFEVRYLVHD